MDCIRVKIFGGIFAVIFSLALASISLGASFTAQMVTRMKGKQTTHPFYFKDSNYRYDKKEQGEDVYVLVRKTDDFMTMVVPSKKGFIRVPKKMAVFMEDNVIEAHSWASKKYYKLASKTQEKLEGLKCTKKIYTIKGASGPIKASEVWVANKYNFPIKIITYHKGKERARVELRDIVEKKLSPSLFAIPRGYKELKPSDLAQRAKRKPAWLKKVKAAPLLKPPFERVLNEGDIIRVKIRKNYTLKFRLESPGPKREQWAEVAYYAFKNSKKIKNLGLYGGSMAPTFRGPPDGADEIVLRVERLSAHIWATEFPSNLIKEVRLRGRETEMLTFREAKKPRLILQDDPKDGRTSFGNVYYRIKGKSVTEKFRLKNGASRSWDLYNLGKMHRVIVKVKRGTVVARLEDASIPAPAVEREKPLPSPPKARVAPKPTPKPSAIKFGQWKIKQFVVMPGLPKPMQAGQWRICLSRKNVIPLRLVESSLCSIKKQDIKGSVVSFDFDCNVGGQKSHHLGTVTYSGDTLKGSYTVQVDDGTKVTYKLKGNRTGKCE